MRLLNLFVSNLTAQWCWRFEDRVFGANEALGGLLSLTHQNKYNSSIYSKRKGRRWVRESSEQDKAESPFSLIARF